MQMSRGIWVNHFENNKHSTHAISLQSNTELIIRHFIYCSPEDLHRIRVEHMERQLANLTGLVQKALTQNVPVGPQIPANINQNYLGVPGQYRGGMCHLINIHTKSLNHQLKNK